MAATSNKHHSQVAANPVAETAVFICDGCGACCRTFPIFATRQDAELEPRIADESVPLLPTSNPEPTAEVPTDAFQAGALERAFRLFPLPFHESCCFLATDNRCVIYESRPQVCRQFAPGSPQCQEARHRQQLLPLVPIHSESQLKQSATLE